ncbi:MAG: hypothetical protein WCD34_13390 [Candidatus Acidiferrum sp.]
MRITSAKLLFYLGLCLGCLGVGFAFSQTPHPDLPKPPVKTLSAYSSSLTDVPMFSSFLPIQCDANGNVYFHIDNGNYSAGTIMRLEQGSWKPHLFKLPTNLANDMAFFEFNVTPLGKTRSLEEKRDGQYHVISFDSDTDDIDDARLQIPDHLTLTDFIASEEGTLLVGGYYDGKAPKDMQGKPFLALLQRSGRILRDFTIEGPGPVDLSNVRMKNHDGAGTVGPDGNFYFVSGHAVLVLSAYGDLVRRITIVKPDDDLFASSLNIAGDLISIQLNKSDKEGMIHEQFLVLSASSGEPYTIYVPSDATGGTPVCFSSRSGYTFMRGEKGKLKFVNAPLS